MAFFSPSVHWIRPLLALASVLPLLQACGRSDLQDYLFESDGTISEAGTPSSAGQGTGGTRTTGGSNSTAGVSTTGGTGVGTGGAGTIGGNGTGGDVVVGGSTTIGGHGTAGTGIGGTGIGGTGIGGSGVGGTGVAGAGGTPGGPTITCGNERCDVRSQQCCANFGGLQCIGRNADCPGASLSCTTSNDCSGNDICCISITGDASAASSCKARCNNMGPGRDRQLCQVDADCVPPFRFCTPTVFGVNICTRRP